MLRSIYAKWCVDLMLSEKCCMYKHFKTNFAAEKYLICLPNNMRLLMTNFRICNTRLPIEQGRYNNAPRYQRYCRLCNAQTVGDEFHLLLVCEVISDIRKLYLPRYYLYITNMVKFND